MPRVPVLSCAALAHAALAGTALACAALWAPGAQARSLPRPAPTTPYAVYTQAEQDRIVAQATGGRLTATQGRYHDDACDEDIDYRAKLVDLNDDGQPEVFTELDSECLGGRIGVYLDLYIRDKQGRWQPQFGFPAGYTLLPARHLGFPDIEMGGPGLCAPVWRWNGSKYALFKRCPD